MIFPKTPSIIDHFPFNPTTFLTMSRFYVRPSFLPHLLQLTHPQIPSSSVASSSPSPLTGPSPATKAYPFPSASSPISSLPSDDEEDDLPYPAPLARSAFLASDFTPAGYLATLGARHQTLEDLRGELRGRATELNAELVELVNAEYEGLMGVGVSLRGGDERVEAVRVALLGFEREIKALREGIAARRKDVGGVLAKKREVREELVLARRLLDFGERLGDLERRLGVKSERDQQEEEDYFEDEDEMSEEEEGEEDPTKRVRTTAVLYRQMTQLAEQIGEHPFLEAQTSRIRAVRDALVLDLGAALRSTRAQRNQQALLLKVIASYRDIGEQAEAIRALKAK